MRKLFVCFAVLLCTAFLGAQTTRDASQMVPTGKGWGELQEHAPRKVQSGTLAQYGISYHGGPVMLGNVNVYFIWYGNWNNGARPSDSQTTVTLLKFANGVIGTIDNSRRAAYGYDQRVEVFGSAGAVAVSNKTPDSAVLSDVNGVHGPLPLYFFLERYMDSYRIELEEFVQAVLQDKPPSVTGADGRIPVVIGLAATRSLHEHRPVKISEIG